MKLLSDWESWVGLGYWENYHFMLETGYPPDTEGMGAEIRFRIIFHSTEREFIEELTKCVKEVFSVSDDRLAFDDPILAPSSTTWRVYFKGSIDLKQVQECERLWDQIAEKHKACMILLGTQVITEPNSTE